jgi:hypothetical protein
MKRRIILLLAFAALLSSLMAACPISAKAESTDFLSFPSGVTVYSPLNMTYNSRYLTLNLTLYSAGNMGNIDPQISMTYSVDGKYNGSVPLEVSNPGLHVVTNAFGFVNLPKLSEGSHCLTLYLFGHNQKSLNPKYLSYVDTVCFSISADASDVPPPGWVPQEVAPQDVQPSGIDEKALTYIENVLPLDFTHYIITNTSYELPGLPNSAHRDEAVTFTLNSSDSMLVVNCQFWDGVQYTCDLSVQRGAAAYIRDCSNLLEVARVIIVGHQAQTGVDCSYILKTLDMVTSTENVTTVIFGNVKLAVCSRALPIGVLAVGTDGTLHIQADPSNIRNATSFHWLYTGGSEEQSIFFLSFDNGNLCSLHDDRIISNLTISQADEDMQPNDVTAESSISNETGSESSSEQSAIQSQLDPAFSVLVFAAAASVLGVAAACVGIMLYRKRRLESKKPTAFPFTQDEAESF